VDFLADRLRRDWWVLVVLAVTVIGTLHLGDQGHYRQANFWAGTLDFLAVLPLFWRETRPELAVLANAAATSAYFGLSPGFPDGPIYLSVLFAVFAIASRRQLRAWLPYVGVALVAIMLALVVREVRVDSSSTIGTVARLVWFTMVTSGSAALAVALRSRRETRTEQVRRTATEERLRMAQDLHDGVGHGLAVIAMQAGVALHVLDQDPAAARRSLEAIRDTSKESLDALRAELVRLSPTTGEPAPRTPRNGLDDLEVLADRVRAGGVQVLLDLGPAESVASGVPPEVDAVGYTVVQEALTNVLRHAAASTARVQLRHTGRQLEIAVRDDGRGVSGEPLSHGMGIPGMRSRVEALGGTLAAAPLPGGGFEVRALIPVEPAVGEPVGGEPAVDEDVTP
jgi:signal transduction histidine kinase